MATARTAAGLELWRHGRGRKLPPAQTLVQAVAHAHALTQAQAQALAHALAHALALQALAQA